MEKKIKIGLIGLLIIGIVLVGGLWFLNNQQKSVEENISIEYESDTKCEITTARENDKLTVHTNKSTLFFDVVFTKGFCDYQFDAKRDKNVIRLKLTYNIDTCFDHLACFHFQGKIKGLNAGTYKLEVYNSNNRLMFKEENISIY